MKRLNIELIIRLHELQIEEFGGLNGVRDRNMLESSAHMPYLTYDGQELYPTIISKAACLCFGLIENHPFHDGNKRIGVIAMQVLLQINGIELNVTDEDLIFLGTEIASGELSRKQVLDWILLHTR